MSNDRTGHINWPPWSFDYAVSDSEGLALLNGTFKGKGVFGKFSMPVIRVKYLRDEGETVIDLPIVGGIGGGAGPFADQISWHLGGDHGLQKIANRNHEYIGLTEFSRPGQRWYEISIYSRIGAYHLAQMWYLSDTGFVCPRIFSKGLHINMDHTHHPYWRLDFDIDGSAHNRVYMQDNRGWWFYPKESNGVKVPSTSQRWFVHSERTGRGAWITPGGGDGLPDQFSRIDIAVRRYNQAEEQNPWPFGTGGLGFLNGEDVSDADVVFWYVAHMFHRAAEGSDHWHGAGPDLLVHGYD